MPSLPLTLKPSETDGTPINFPRPTLTGPSQPDESQTIFPPAHILDALLDGQSYHLPSPGEPVIPIILLDGSTAQLFSDKVVMRGQTLKIPSDISASQEISSGGQKIKAQPGESKKPDSKHHSGGGGGGAIGGFFKTLT
jgi:hypothetical protein